MPFTERLPEVPILACSATATDKVAQDIIRELRLQNPLLQKSTVNRPNLFYSVKQKSVGGAVDDLGSVLRGTTGSAIVYTLTKNESEELAQLINKRLHVSAAAYHGGMTDMARKDVQNLWSRDEIRVVCAT